MAEPSLSPAMAVNALNSGVKTFMKVALNLLAHFVLLKIQANLYLPT